MIGSELLGRQFFLIVSDWKMLEDLARCLSSTDDSPLEPLKGKF